MSNYSIISILEKIFGLPPGKACGSDKALEKTVTDYLDSLSKHLSPLLPSECTKSVGCLSPGTIVSAKSTATHSSKNGPHMANAFDTLPSWLEKGKLKLDAPKLWPQHYAEYQNLLYSQILSVLNCQPSKSCGLISKDHILDAFPTTSVPYALTVLSEVDGLASEFKEACFELGQAFAQTVSMAEAIAETSKVSYDLETEMWSSPPPSYTVKTHQIPPGQTLSLESLTQCLKEFQAIKLSETAGPSTIPPVAYGALDMMKKDPLTFIEMFFKTEKEMHFEKAMLGVDWGTSSSNQNPLKTMEVEPPPPKDWRDERVKTPDLDYVKFMVEKLPEREMSTALDRALHWQKYRMRIVPSILGEEKIPDQDGYPVHVIVMTDGVETVKMPVAYLHAPRPDILASDYIREKCIEYWRTHEF